MAGLAGWGAKKAEKTHLPVLLSRIAGIKDPAK